MLIFYKLTPADKEAIRSSKAVLLDVRSPEEFGVEHANSARNYDVELIDAGKYPDINRDKPIFTYCRSGARSERAKLALTNAGFTNVKNIGGLTDIAI